MILKKDKTLQILGEVITEFRKTVGFSQERLALESGLARSFVSEIERGVKQPTAHTLLIIGYTLKIKPSKIMAEVEKRLKWKWAGLFFRDLEKKEEIKSEDVSKVKETEEKKWSRLFGDPPKRWEEKKK